MNLSILLTDFIDTKGMLKTYRFIPINQYNRIVVDRLSDICTDVKGNTDKDVGLLRVYNSDKCQLLSTTCKSKILQTVMVRSFSVLSICLYLLRVLDMEAVVFIILFYLWTID